MMEQPSNPAEARFVDEQVHVEHVVQSDSVFRRDADGIVPESPGHYMLA